MLKKHLRTKVVFLLVFTRWPSTHVRVKTEQVFPGTTLNPHWVQNSLFSVLLFVMLFMIHGLISWLSSRSRPVIRKSHHGVCREAAGACQLTRPVVALTLTNWPPFPQELSGDSSSSSGLNGLLCWELCGEQESKACGWFSQWKSPTWGPRPGGGSVGFPEQHRRLSERRGALLAWKD